MVKSKTGITTSLQGKVFLPISKLDGPYKETVEEGVLDKGVGYYVNVLREHGIETFESCQGGARSLFS